MIGLREVRRLSPRSPRSEVVLIRVASQPNRRVIAAMFAAVLFNHRINGVTIVLACPAEVSELVAPAPGTPIWALRASKPVLDEVQQGWRVALWNEHVVRVGGAERPDLNVLLEPLFGDFGEIRPTLVKSIVLVA